MSNHICVCSCHSAGATIGCLSCAARHDELRAQVQAVLDEENRKLAAIQAEKARKLEAERAVKHEILGGPLDGQFSGVPGNSNTFEHNGHLYTLESEDTGAKFWKYAGYCIVGG